MEQIIATQITDFTLHNSHIVCLTNATLVIYTMDGLYVNSLHLKSKYHYNIKPITFAIHFSGCVILGE